jgi:uncharacterized protein Yka (UPF0111/DUF47 family)
VSAREHSWFLPETPEVLRLLRAQTEITLEGMRALEAWSRGDREAAGRVRAAEHRGDVAKREVLTALRDAFVTEVEPEDLFSLSRGVDTVLNYTKDLVNEAELLAPDGGLDLAEIATLLRTAVEAINAAIAQLRSDPDAAIAAADEAIATARDVEHAYYRGMAELLEQHGRSERISGRELYRRCERIAEVVIGVSERIVYTVVKQS